MIIFKGPSTITTERGIDLQEQQVKKVGVFKCGNIATAPLFELLLDELADRKDIRVRTVTTGSKMSVEDVKEALPKIFSIFRTFSRTVTHSSIRLPQTTSQMVTLF